MDINIVIDTILNEPIYLTIVLIFGLIIIYSILKKFFKILLITLTALLLYIAYLIITDSDLPGDSENVINPMIENAGEVIDKISDEIKKINESE